MRERRIYIMIRTNAIDIALNDTTLMIRRLLTLTPPFIREQTTHLSKAHGKGFRARALIVCSLNDSGDIDKEAVPCAAVVELIHLASLVHDDVIDDGNLRRGIETLNKRYGSRMAVLCGDYVLAQAMNEIQKLRIFREKTAELCARAIMDLCKGELLQHVHSNDFNISVRDYLKIISGKTAALFELSFALGAMACGQPEREYRLLGKYLGLLFQIVDDCIDMESDVNAAGKNVAKDFSQGVITLPVVFAMENPSVKRRLLAGEVEPELLIKLVHTSGGMDRAKETAAKYFHKGMKLIAGLNMTEEKRLYIKELFEKSFNRQG